jgi:hypothetical protein
MAAARVEISAIPLGAHFLADSISNEEKNMEEKHQRLTKAENVLVEDLDGEAVLLNLDNGQYYGLDKIGYHLFQQLVALGSFDEAIISLQDVYEVDPAQLRRDMEALLEEMLANGLVVPA